MMLMIHFKHKGNFDNVEKFFKKSLRNDYRKIVEKYAQDGVKALAESTPVDTGKTASSWGYTIKYSDGKIVINWTNSNIQDGVPIALILQYGHALRNGAYIQGKDYINPAIRPVFDQLSESLWREVRP